MSQTALTDRNTKLDNYLQNQMRKTGNQVRVIDLFTCCMKLFAGLLGGLFLLAIVDGWILELSGWARWLSLFVLLGGSVAYTVVAIVPLLIHKINPVFAAKVVESSQPDMKNSLINYLLLRQQPGRVSRRVVEIVGSKAANDISGVPVENTVDKSHTIRAALILTVLVVVLGAYKVLSPKDPFQSFARIIAPASDITKPARVSISGVDPGNCEVFFGQSLQVSAFITGNFDENDAKVVFSTLDGQIVDGSIHMEKQERDRYTCQLKTGEHGIEQSLRYKVVAGDGVSNEYTVQLTSSPILTVQSISYQPPKYMELEEYTEKGVTTIKHYEGTQVTLDAIANTDIKNCYVQLLREDAGKFRQVDKVSMDKIDDRHARCRFGLQLNAARNGPRYTHYQLHLITNDGGRSRSVAANRIIVNPDMAPTVMVVDPQETELEVPENSRIRFEVEANDVDFRLSGISVAVENASRRVAKEDIDIGKQNLAQRVSINYEMWPKKMLLRSGDIVDIQFAAFDNRVPDPNMTLSNRFRVRITDAVDNPPNDDQSDGQPEDEPSNQEDGQAQDPKESGNEGEGEGEESDEGQGSESADPKEGDSSEGPEGSEGQQDQSANEGPSGEGENNEPSESGTEGQGGSQSSSEGQSQDSQSEPGEQTTGDQQEQMTGDSESESSQTGQSGDSQPGGQASDSGTSGDDAPLGEGASEGQIFEEVMKHRDQQQQDAANQQGTAGNEPSGNEQSGQESQSQPQGGNPAADQSTQDSGQNGSDPSQEDSESKSGDGQSQDGSDPAGDQPGDQNPSGNSPETDDNGMDQKGQSNSESTNEGNSEKEAGQSGTSQQEQDDQSGGGSDQQSSGSDQSEDDKENQDQSSDGGAQQEKSEEQQQQSGAGGNQEEQSESGGGKQETSGSKQGNSGESGSQSGNSQTGSDQKESDGNPSDNSSPQSSNSGSGEQNSESGQASESGQGQQSNSQSGSRDGAQTPPQGSDQSDKTGDDQEQEQQTGNDRSESQGNQKGQSNPDSAQSTGQSASQQGKNGNQNQQESGPESGSGSEPGQQDGGQSSNEQSGGNRPGAGGASNQASSRSGGSEIPAGDQATTADEANLEYTRKATDMALEYLDEQQIDPDPKLLDKLNWSEEDLRDFVERWKQLKKQANSSDDKLRKDAERKMQSLGLSPGDSTARRFEGASDDQQGYIEDGRVDAPPPELADRFRLFTRKRNEVKDER